MAQHPQRDRGGGPPRQGGGPPQSGQHSGRGGGRDGAGQHAALDTSRIVFGKTINARLYSDIAEAVAKEVGAGRDQNKPTQLRRFYDELVLLQGKVGDSAERFAQQHPFIQMLKAKVAYAEGREKVDRRFSSLLRHVVDQVRDHDTLRQARFFMEAFMGFYKVYRPRD
jgi:CRISPR-associated protein Csm2